MRVFAILSKPVEEGEDRGDSIERDGEDPEVRGGPLCVHVAI